MNTHDPFPRSPTLMSRDDTALLVVDVQQKLLPHIHHGQRIAWNVRRLVDAAAAMNLPTAATEQYPKGLGPTIAELAKRLDPPPEKLMFSCRQCSDLFADWADRGVRKILVAGIETHVCVQQTVLDLLSEGFALYVAVDAVGSRFAVDHETALRRMDSSGALLTTTEAAMFEWCEVAGTPEFKQISRLARETPPGDSA